MSGFCCTVGTTKPFMPTLSFSLSAFFGLYTNSASSTPSLRNNMRECSPLPAPKRRCRSSTYGCDVLRLHRQDAIVPICPKSNSFLFCSILFFLFVLQSLFLFTCQSAFNFLYIFCWRKVLWNYTTLHKHISNRQYALGLYGFLLEGLWSVHSHSSFLPQNPLL